MVFKPTGHETDDPVFAFWWANLLPLPVCRTGAAEKSKAELKAQRRALQDAQRAAKVQVPASDKPSKPAEAGTAPAQPPPKKAEKEGGGRQEQPHVQTQGGPRFRLQVHLWWIGSSCGRQGGSSVQVQISNTFIDAYLGVHIEITLEHRQGKKKC